MSFKEFDRKVAESEQDVHHQQVEWQLTVERAKDERLWHFFKIFGIVVIALLVILGGF